MTLVYDGITDPVEIAPGRGDLRYTSTPLLGGMGAIPTSIALLDKQISFAKLYVEQPNVAIAINWFLRQSMRVPLKAYRRTGDDSRERLGRSEHPVADAIVDPWDGGSQIALIWAMFAPRLVHGNSVTEVDEGARNKIRFTPADWRCANPIRPWPDTIGGWELNADDKSRAHEVPADRVLHIKGWSPLGPFGVSPLQQLGTTLSVDDAARRYQQGLFKNGARPPSAITASEQFLGLDLKERTQLLANLREDLNGLHVGPDNAGRPPLLPPGLDWKAVGHTAVEAELIDQRRVNREETGGVYGLNQAAFGIFDRNADVAELRTMNYLDALAPELLLAEGEFNAQVIRRLLRLDDIYVEFDFAGILRGDRLKEIEALREAIASALLTPNEGRTVLNMPTSDIEAMSKFYLPFNNLWPVDQDPPKSGDRNLQQADTSGPGD